MTTANEVVEILRTVTYDEDLDPKQKEQLKRLFADDPTDARKEWELWSEHLVLIVGSFEILLKLRSLSLVKERKHE